MVIEDRRTGPGKIRGKCKGFRVLEPDCKSSSLSLKSSRIRYQFERCKTIGIHPLVFPILLIPDIILETFYDLLIVRSGTQDGDGRINLVRSPTPVEGQTCIAGKERILIILD